MLDVISRVIEKVMTDREADAVQGKRKAAAVSVKGTLHLGPDAFGHQEQHHNHQTPKSTV